MASRVHCAPAFAALSFLVLLLAPPAAADGLPRSWQAMPGVYKVLAEGDQYQVVMATWKPGQRDLPHVHAAAGIYFLTDCKLRLYAADGSAQGEIQRFAGFAQVQPPVPGHAIENAGGSECRVLMFEGR